MKFKSSQLVSATNQLKLPAAEGKKVLIDVADTDQILLLIQTIPSKRSMQSTAWPKRTSAIGCAANAKASNPSSPA